MRNTDEQLSIILDRSEKIAEKRILQKKLINEGIVSLVCVVLLVLTAIYIPGIAASGNATAGEQYGSLILSTAYMGYVVVGLISLVLGVLLTLIAQHYKKLVEKTK